MRKDIITNKTFLFFTLLFILMAAFSFAAFKEKDHECTDIMECSQAAPSINRGEMLWDAFSRRLILLVSFE